MKAKDKGAFSGAAVLIVLAVVGVIIFALAQTGSARAAGGKIAGGLSEMTGGLLGKGNRKKD